MRLVTYSTVRDPRAGVLWQGGIVDCWDAIGGEGSSVRELLETGRLDAVAAARDEAIAVEEIELHPPVPDPRRSSASA